MTDTALSQTAGHEALEILRLMMQDGEASDASRVSAAKALLDRFTPKDDVERKRRDEDERQAAIAEARCLLAELAAAEPVGADEPLALVANRATAPDYTTDDSNE